MNMSALADTAEQYGRAEHWADVSALWSRVASALRSGKPAYAGYTLGRLLFHAANAPNWARRGEAVALVRDIDAAYERAALAARR